ncbi:hypothetical protein [Kytococcus sp. Marseille-QA3725]
MPPSLLVLVLVVLVWVGFGAQWWWRRRDHLRTVKSMDAFLDAMDALDHSVQVPEPRGGIDHRPAQWVSPSAPAEPTVTVKPRRDAADIARVRARQAEGTRGAAEGELFSPGTVRELLASKPVRAGLLLAPALGLLVSFVGALAGGVSWFWVVLCVLALSASVVWSRVCAEAQLRGQGLRPSPVRQGAREVPAGGRSGSGRARVARTYRPRSSAPVRAQRSRRVARTGHAPTGRPASRGTAGARRRPAQRRIAA